MAAEPAPRGTLRSAPFGTAQLRPWQRPAGGAAEAAESGGVAGWASGFAELGLTGCACGIDRF